jgi:hypothetical protein
VQAFYGRLLERPMSARSKEALKLRAKVITQENASDGNTPFQEIVEYYADLLEVNIIVDALAFKSVNCNMVDIGAWPIRMPQFKKYPCRHYCSSCANRSTAPM